MLVFWAWFTEKHFFSILFAVYAVVVPCWPFIALIFVPFALYIFYIKSNKSGIQGVLEVIKLGVISIMIIMPITLSIDYHYYKKFVFPAANIFLYNLFGGGGGDADKLYGVEPASYYINNILLNLNKFQLDIDINYLFYLSISILSNLTCIIMNYAVFRINSY